MTFPCTWTPTPEIDRSFISNYGTRRSYHAFIIKVYTDLCGPEAGAKYQEYPILNTGVFAIPAESPIGERWSARIAESLAHGRNLERAAAGGELMGFVHNGFWRPMDTKKDADDLNKMWVEDNAPWKVWSLETSSARKGRGSLDV